VLGRSRAEHATLPASLICSVTGALTGHILGRPIDWSISRSPDPRSPLRVAAVQLNSTGDKARNLATAERLVRAAAADGAELVALREKWNRVGGGDELVAGAEPLDGPSLAAARAWARELGIHLLAGSIAERGGEKAWNTSVLIGPGGEDLAAYRKLHLFDV